MRQEYKRLQQGNEDLRQQIESLDQHHLRHNTFIKETPNRSVTATGHNHHDKSNAILEELSYHQNLESHSIDMRVKRMNPGQASQNILNNGQITTSSGTSNTTNLYKTSVSGANQSFVNEMSQEKQQELMRLKKEYHQMVRKEMGGKKGTTKDSQTNGSASTGYIDPRSASKSPDRLATAVSTHQYMNSSHNNSFAGPGKSPYTNSSKQPVDYNGSTSGSRQVLKDTSNGKKAYQQMATNMGGPGSSINHKRAKSQSKLTIVI